MSQELWSDVDHYIAHRLIGPDPILDAVLAENGAAGLPAIDVAPNQGKLLHILAKLAGARRILEIGTLGGYSTIWLARALPDDGELVTLELDPRHAGTAERNVEAAGLADQVRIIQGRAIETLPRLAEAGLSFDLVFIDADKPSNPDYLNWALRLTRPGSLIIVDNVVRSGGMTDPGSADPAILGTRALFDLVSGHPNLDATAIQTVGVKGYDGFLVARVR